MSRRLLFVLQLHLDALIDRLVGGWLRVRHTVHIVHLCEWDLSRAGCVTGEGARRTVAINGEGHVQESSPPRNLLAESFSRFRAPFSKQRFRRLDMVQRQLNFSFFSVSINYSRVIQCLELSYD